jgi:hypothetical protein
MAGFGAQTDYFGLADTDWELQSCKKTPTHSSAQAQDEYNDTAAETEYEKTEGVECVYRLVGNGALGVIGLPADFQGGQTNEEDGVIYMISGGTLVCSNTERPLLTVTGVKHHGDTAALRLYDFAGAIGNIGARKVATPIGFTVGVGSLLNSCTVTFSMEVTRALDSDGAVAITDNSKARIESTGTLVSAAGVPAATVAANWTKPNDVDLGEANTAYPDGSVMVYQNVAPEE